MDPSALLEELFGRIPPLASRAVDGLTAAQLHRIPAEGTNSIGWLVWHLARVQDHHVAELQETEQIWATGDWAARVGLDADPQNIGFGHDAKQMAAVKPDSAEVLVAYLDAVQSRTMSMLPSVNDDLDRVVDDRWDPPVTLGVRLVSIADDSLQHVGQANYLRGVFDF